MHLDHVIIATTDPARSAQRLLETTGLRAVTGGIHDSLGTYNYIAPLGDGYLEVVAVHDSDMAALNPFGQLVLAALNRADEDFAGWAVEITSADLHDRATTDGLRVGRLTRRGVGIAHAGLDQVIASSGLPFFLAREADSAHPQHMSVHHDVTPRGLAAIAVGESADQLNRWLAPRTDSAPPSLAVETLGTGQGVLSVEIDTVGGPVLLSSSDPTKGQPQ